MASLARLALRKCVGINRCSVQLPARLISSTSASLGGGPPGGPTDSLGGIYTAPNEHKPPTQEEISAWVRKEMEGSWKSYGFDYNDQTIDTQRNAWWFFLLVTWGAVLNIVIHAYRGDVKGKDWSIREAYLLLREREAAGVEPLSRDLVDPEKVLAHLPSDEELQKMGVKIII